MKHCHFINLTQVQPTGMATPGLALVKMALQLHEVFNFAQMLQGERPGTDGSARRSVKIGEMTGT